MSRTISRLTPGLVILIAAYSLSAQPERTVRVDLAYRAPGTGPQPNFSPYGTQVKLSDLPPNTKLPDGAARPAKTGTIQVGPSLNSGTGILVTADPEHPKDLCRLYVDRNRNGDFSDDGPALTATPSMNEKTKGWWSSINRAEISVPYGGGVTEPYMVNFWSVREGDNTPDVIRYSVASWRSGTVKVDGIDALVAVMDADNDAIFSAKDKWSVVGAGETNAIGRVLSHEEARPTDRLMFLPKQGGKDLVLEFRALSPDGRSLTFAVIDRPVTKAQDRGPDDSLASERSRPRATQAFTWAAGFDRAVAQAKESNKKLIIDFWTSWCGPCHQLDEWVWTDAEVAGLLNAGYVGVKLDGDMEKDLVSRFHVEGYPTIIVLDHSGKELRRSFYLSSQEMVQSLRR